MPKKKTVNIILAEDNSISRKMASHIMETQGCFVKVAPNGQTVLDLLEKQAFDLILMDLEMPVMDGFTATRKIRQSDADYCAIPIVAMTAHTSKENHEKCLASGMNDCIAKPVEPRTLKDLCAKMKIRLKGQDSHEPMDHAGMAAKGFSPTDPMDLEGALRRANGKKAFVKKLLDYLVESMPERLEEMAKFIENDHPEQLAHQAHGLKGVAATLGITPMTEAALKMEKMGKRKDLTQGPTVLNEIKAVLSRLEAFIDTIDWS